MGDYPVTEEGLQSALSDRAKAQKEGDLQAEAKAALALSYLVKWVRSDNDEPPFVRSFTLASEALALSVACGDRYGEARALLLGVQLFETQGNLERQRRAETIARELGDQNLIGQALAAQGRTLGLVDKAAAVACSREALKHLEATDDTLRQAACHFSLSLYLKAPAERIQHSLEAFRLYRLGGNKSEASRALFTSMLAAETDEEKSALEPHFLSALSDAREAQNPGRIKQLLMQLVLIKAAQQDFEGSKAYLDEAKSLFVPTELDPVEQWESDVYFTELLLKVCLQNGQTEAAKEFKQALRDLKKNKPQR